MGLKVVNYVFLAIVLLACLTQSAFGKPTPRDSTVVEDQSVVPINTEALPAKEDIKPQSEAITESRLPGRVSCDFEEANEDAVCQEHCLPKGYTYGICVSHTCSCI